MVAFCVNSCSSATPRTPHFGLDIVAHVRCMTDPWGEVEDPWGEVEDPRMSDYALKACFAP